MRRNDLKSLFIFYLREFHELNKMNNTCNIISQTHGAKQIAERHEKN